MAETLPIMAVLDTDTFYGAGDRFALACALPASEVIDLRAVVADLFEKLSRAWKN
jgi:hypothetical protein